MFKKLSKLILKLCGISKDTPIPPPQPNPSTDFFDLPPNSTPIDSVVETEKNPDRNHLPKQPDVPKESSITPEDSPNRVVHRESIPIRFEFEYYAP